MAVKGTAPFPKLRPLPNTDADALLLLRPFPDRLQGDCLADGLCKYQQCAGYCFNPTGFSQGLAALRRARSARCRYGRQPHACLTHALCAPLRAPLRAPTPRSRRSNLLLHPAAPYGLAWLQARWRCREGSSSSATARRAREEPLQEPQTLYVALTPFQTHDVHLAAQIWVAVRKSLQISWEIAANAVSQSPPPPYPH